MDLADPEASRSVCNCRKDASTGPALKRLGSFVGRAECEVARVVGLGLKKRSSVGFGRTDRGAVVAKVVGLGLKKRSLVSTSVLSTALRASLRIGSGVRNLFLLGMKFRCIDSLLKEWLEKVALSAHRSK